MRRDFKISTAAALLLAMTATDAVSDEDELDEITVTADRVANTRPAGSYASAATALRFDPQTELQSRGLAEGQADVTVRGGLFENTGFKAGAVTIMDPQTGHYVAELPIDPALLGSPEILTGIDNALSGFNSSIATVAYALRRIRKGGSIQAGVGTDSLDYQSLWVANTTPTSAGASLGYAISMARSEGDGTIDNGDHDFARYNLHLQRAADGAQTDLVLSLQEKFYGWPGAYTGFATLPETDDTTTTLLLANHRVEHEGGHLEIGGFYRRLEDDYDFNRNTLESGAPGSFDHETRVFGLGVQGSRRGERLDWHYAGQVTTDDLVFSTDLTEGDFDSRDYMTASLVPTLDIARNDGGVLSLRFGAVLDWTSEDGSAVSPVVGATLRSHSDGGSRYVSLDYAATSQVPGYTALKSRPAGLFGGNAGLGREKARQLSLSAGIESRDWTAEVTLFYREDDDLVDWTFVSGAPFARQANAVDIDVMGVEALVKKRWQTVEIVAGYTWLDKDADYGTALVDASFYALNFATHRATLAARIELADSLVLLIDNEYRDQADNPLRASSDQAYVVSASLSWAPQRVPGFSVAVIADNLTDDDYEQFPGTPAIGRQVSLSARYAW